MTRPLVFRSVPPDLQARVRFGVDIAALDEVIDGDTCRVLLLRHVGDPGCIDIRIRDLDKHELHDRDPLLVGQLAQERQELVNLFVVVGPVFTVHYQITRRGNVVMSFERAVASILLDDGRDVATSLQPVRAARVARLRKVGMYPQQKEHNSHGV